MFLLYSETVGFYERAQEILAVADSSSTASVWHFNCVDARLRSRSFYLYSVLTADGSCSAISSLSTHFVDSIVSMYFVNDDTIAD
jgi:hypothetical protein